MADLKVYTLDEVKEEFIDDKELSKFTYPIEAISYKGSILFDQLQETETVLPNNEECALTWFDYEYEENKD